MDAKKEELIELVKSNPEICDTLLSLLHQLRNTIEEADNGTERTA